MAITTKDQHGTYGRNRRADGPKLDRNTARYYAIVDNTPRCSHRWAATMLRLLYTHATHERFVYRHRWSDGDFIIWDNRCTMHIALADYDARRRMHRVSVLGAGPIAPAN